MRFISTLATKRYREDILNQPWGKSILPKGKSIEPQGVGGVQDLDFGVCSLVMSHVWNLSGTINSFWASPYMELYPGFDWALCKWATGLDLEEN